MCSVPCKTERDDTVSIIVPVYNDSESLIKCIESLLEQDISNEYEIIVVDNGSHNFNTYSAEINKKYPSVILLQELSPGSYAARNKGLSIAKGKVIAFTDSDCIAHKSWLSTAIKRLQKVDMVGGRIEVFYKDPQNPTSVELYESVFAFDQKSAVARGHSVTANLLVKKIVIDKVGVFNSKTFSGGDIEFTDRANKAGFKIDYSEDAMVYHPARRKYSEYQNKLRRVIGGQFVLKHENDIFMNNFTLKALIKDLLAPFKFLFISNFIMKIDDCDLLKRLRIFNVVLHNRYYSFYCKVKMLILGGKNLTR
ncbi:glycosyltransferase [Pseudoalteromonas distincta]|uniref:Glycosyltransferase n=1 Tax=Pseudoalteromonas distincta TaxID=77608 RepID=A0A4P9IXS5_9GAMM|nr:glycosyltransferase [Pseudoalteromonas distincta]QCU73136.1 glycosyltransferase [Pseudoalteromonas distincta]